MIEDPRAIRHFTSPAKPRNPRDSTKSRGPAPPPPPVWRTWLVYIGLLPPLLLLFRPSIAGGGVTTPTHSQFTRRGTSTQASPTLLAPDRNGGAILDDRVT